MYNYNNIDRSKEEGLSDWWYSLSETQTPNTRPHRRVRDFSSIINKIIKLIPTNSTQGKSKFHS